MSEFNLETGDMLLFTNNSSFFSSLIKKFTHSEITHVGFVLKDPIFIHPSLKGYYVWESGKEEEPDPQDNKKKFGVQITPFREMYESYKKNNGFIYVRHISKNDKITNKKLAEIHQVVYDKPYDIVPTDWIEAYFKKDTNPQKTNRFWCSALLGFIYTKLGILDKTTDWSILSPVEFLNNDSLKFNVKFSDYILI